MLNEDYRDMLHALSNEKVRFLLVGAYALAAHGYPRATMDILDGIEAYMMENKIPRISDIIGSLKA